MKKTFIEKSLFLLLFLIVFVSCSDDDNNIDCENASLQTQIGRIFIEDQNGNTLIGPDNMFQFQNFIFSNESTFIPLEFQELPGNFNAVNFDSSLMGDSEDFKFILNEDETQFVIIKIKFKTIEGDCFDQRVFDVVTVNGTIAPSENKSFSIIF
ncbi:hypothetical protein ULMS_20310 [Patiriisocius marinistellae]|uniref:MSP domain-containing protein n=1 Tax=Patiriisocius marinistellae TaxID=2494560 RepID=A0A5J4FWW7_9FLAO|nr:hypothetical protein [Patiriisocius marinistellae]GEQ86523.1 hypothetical protein ULMS_20310 [Patiriisocius marinistellae]